MFMLSAHYRSPLHYSADILHQAQNSLDRLYSAEDHLKYLAANGAEGDKNAAEAASDTGSSKARAAVTVSGDILVFTLTNPVADADEAFTAAQGPAAANRKKGGSGTGLIVVRRILEACRGRLSLTALSEGQFSATVTFCVAGYSPRTVSNKN